MADVPAGILQVVETFDRNIEAYRSQEYNEAQLRREFIDPFFEELGWDITNKQGFAPQYREVIHENSIKVSGETKAPDYCFRIGGARKFFLEAKKPAVNIKADPDPAYQLRRYAWSAKLPLSILTNFETFAVYDCQIRPKHTDRPTTARIINLTYKEYLDKWNEIASIFSKDAVLKGSFDKYAISPKGKRGTTTVDTEFLAEIENWRKMLAQIIALRNRSLSIREINFAVQQTVDRILFLRLCEDRGIEPYGQLRAISSGDRNYPRLCEIFEKADQKYNSGLFHFHDEPGRAEPPDELTLNLNIDDTPIKWILYHLYYPQSPYEFSVLPAEILGNVYEQFLGKVIRLTPGHRAVLEEKPEVKKAGGVYYTPSYIVDYIVKNTVGKLCEGKTPAQISKLKILDPACGSGSFLLGAYTYLVDYHRDWYTENDPENWLKKKNPPIYEVTASRHCEESASDDEAISNYRLTVTEKKRILLNNIFGVDIDSQAVEVTKLSLLLKVLEGENQQTLENQYRLFHERALPDLGNNIKCGNSLIGPDFYDSLAPTPAVGGISDELRNRINAFDWQDGFPEIFNRPNPGFDAVIGNPPYNAALMEKEEAYLQKRYEGVRMGRQDTAAIFVEAGLRLSRQAVMYLLPYRLISRKRNHGPFQKWLYHNSRIEEVVYMGKIKDIRVNDEFMVMRIRKSPHTDDWTMLVAPHCTIDSIEGVTPNFDKIRQRNWGPPNYQMNIRLGRFNKQLLVKIEMGSAKLGDIAQSRDGIVPFIRDKLVSDCKQDDRYKPLLGIRGFYSLDCYTLSWGGTYICYDMAEARKYIRDKKELRKVQLRDESIFLRAEKILTAQDSITIKGTLDTQRFYTTNSIHTTYMNDNTKYDIRYVLGLMNSKALNYYHQSLVLKGQDLHPQVLVTNLPKLPIPRIKFYDAADKSRHDSLVNLVQRMLDLHKKLAEAKIPDEKTRIQRQIDITDKQIENLVYDLYGLTEEEIGIVEKNI
jgi:hypothetical protein